MENTQKFDIHICTISKEAAANLLPILEENFKPKKAVFLISSEMANEANYLAEAFKRKNVEVEYCYLKSNVFDYESLDNELYDIFSQYMGENIAINITGGTKPQAISAMNNSTLLECPIFYVDSNTNRVFFLSKDDKPFDLNVKFDLDTYLTAYGYKIIGKEVTTKTGDWKKIGESFIQKISQYKDVVPLLNKHATKAKNGVLKSSLDAVDLKVNAFLRLLDELKYAYDDFIEFADNTIYFKNEGTRFFLNGGWLEDYVFSRLNKLKQDNIIDDIACNVKAVSPDFDLKKSEKAKENKGLMNEFDLAFIAKNRLHIIECKTSKMDKEEGVAGDNILYKLETLKDYGGLMTQKCLVSYIKVPDSVKQRAEQLKIKIIEGNEIQQINNKIQEWIES